MSDPTIEQIEAELNQSRFAPWDVETFLAKRHQAKIEALNEPSSERVRWLQVAVEIITPVFTLIGFVTANYLLGVWLLTGDVPLP